MSVILYSYQDNILALLLLLIGLTQSCLQEELEN